MISVLETIPIEQPFMFQRQGYYHLSDNFPIADGSRLLPFVSRPFFLALGVKPSGTLRTICGEFAADIGILPTVLTNDKTTFYWSAGRDSGVDVPMGKYYIECSAEIDPQNVPTMYNAWQTRVLAAGGEIVAGQCMYDALLDLAGGAQTLKLFKTEPFIMPASTTTLKGSFNQSFNESFDV